MIRKTTVLLLLCLLFFGGYLLFSSKPQIKNTSPSGENIICFGDSLTRGTGATEGMDYPSQLSKMISKPVINVGVAGDTTARALTRLERDVLRQAPRIVLITLGGNDLKNGVPTQTAFGDLGKIVKAIQGRGALVVVGGIDVPLWGRGYGNAYKELCKETGCVLIPDILEGIFGNGNLMSDPIHPNGAGYGIVAQRFFEAIKPYLNTN